MPVCEGTNEATCVSDCEAVADCDDDVVYDELPDVDCVVYCELDWVCEADSVWLFVPLGVGDDE